MVDEMKNRRSEMQTMSGTIREREERYRALAEEFERMPKNVDRSMYTYRIMDIIKQVRKQKIEILKVLENYDFLVYRRSNLCLVLADHQ
jgi:hypothetical protein